MAEEKQGNMDTLKLLEQLLAYIEANRAATRFGPVIPRDFRERRERATQAKAELETTLAGCDAAERARIQAILSGLTRLDRAEKDELRTLGLLPA